MLYINEADQNRIGLNDLLSECYCRSPQGRRLKAERHLYTPAERQALQADLEAVGQLLQMIREKSEQIGDLQALLLRMRELRASLHGLENDRLLDDSEFFEIKRSLAIFRQIAALEDVCARAGVHFLPLDEAEALLNPSASYNPGFYIYSEYSADLLRIREEKRRLENQIARSEVRGDLLAERARVCAQEENEENRVRAQIGRGLKPWLAGIQANANALGLLDFRLARAELANKWQATCPVVVGAGCPAEIKEAWHPLIAEQLTQHGDSFTHQSLRLEPGSTILSGANMGGKSVALQSTFLALLMAQMGYFVPAANLRTPLFEFFVFAGEAGGESGRGLSSFGMEASVLRDSYRLSEGGRGLIVMDEPCRGTNPHEATAIVRALCRNYAQKDSIFLIATHYRVPQMAGIRFYQVRGIREDVLDVLAPIATDTDAQLRGHFVGVSGDSSSAQTELALIRQIHRLMDYHLDEVSGEEQAPSGAIRIAELLGVDPKLVQAMRKAWQEEKWQH